MSAALPRYKVVVAGHQKSAKILFALGLTGRISQSEKEGGPTIGSGFVSTWVEIADGRSVDLEIWDMSSQEKYVSIAPVFLHDASVVLLCFCRHLPETVQALKDVWIKCAHEHAPDAVTILVAVPASSQVDQAEASEHVAMSDSEIEALAQELGASKWASLMPDSPDQAKDLARTIAETCVSRYGFPQPSAEAKEPSSEAGSKGACNVA